MRNWNDDDLDQIAHLVTNGTPWDVICDLFAMSRAELADILLKRISTYTQALADEPQPYQHAPGRNMVIRKEHGRWNVYHLERLVMTAPTFGDAASFATLAARPAA